MTKRSFERLTDARAAFDPLVGRYHPRLRVDRGWRELGEGSLPTDDFAVVPASKEPERFRPRKE